MTIFNYLGIYELVIYNMIYGILYTVYIRYNIPESGNLASELENEINYRNKESDIALRSFH